MTRVKTCLALAAFLLAGPARAGKLDLDLYANTRPRFARSTPAPAPFGPWRPGDPRNAQGESFTVQAIATGGNAGLGLAGVAQNAGSVGKSREAAAMTAGFGALAVINLWRSWKLWREPAAREPSR
ncbi:MAG: hypothetical protein HYX59_00295 [Elusimicrobia bacterium]|nr:hypothetical protein [Elusimicrobiota bacterium]